MGPITPPGGNTPQATQLNQGATTPLNPIPNPVALQNASAPQLASNYTQAATAANQMQADTPAWQEAQQSQYNQQAGLPQITGQYGLDMNTFMNLLQNDPLGQRYLNPSALNQTGAVGNFTGTDPNAPGVVSALPEMTMANVNDPFHGFTDPITAFNAGNTEQANIIQTLNNLSSLFGYNQGKVSDQLSQDLTKRTSQISSLSNIADIFLNAYNAKQTAANVAPSPQQVSQQIQADAQKKMTLQQLLNKYSGVADPNSIYNIYNRYNYGTGKNKVGYGDAKEDSQTLYRWGVTQAKPTASQLKQQQTQSDTDKTASNLTKTFNDVLDSYKNMNPFEKHMPISVASQIPMLAPTMATMNTKYFLGLEPELRKLVVGGRITVQEMNWIKQAILPVPGDSDESYSQRVNSALDLVNRSGSGANTSAGGGTNKNDPLGIL